ncbi:MAG: nicotinate-nucleotide adenylyltransferase [Candidatus Limnocylindrales bacterium]
MTDQRWGILGGIFDPVHYGHLAMAQQAREELDLAAVLFVPAGQPVHRDAPQTPAQDRLRMTELAIADNPAFAVSRYEIDRPEPSYTVDTLEALATHESRPNLVLILSAETAALMPTTWRSVDRILELAQIAIVNRLAFADITPDWLAANFPGRQDRFSLLHTSRLGNSATDIRARVAAGRSIRYLVPPAVEAYIGEHHLYGET